MAGLSTFFPKYESVEAVHGRIIKRARPLFPGYLFFCQIGVPLAHAWHWVFGVSVDLEGADRIKSVLGMLTGKPYRLPQEVIDELRDRTDPDGVIRFKTKKKSRFRHGQRVRVRDGILVGHEAIVEALKEDGKLAALFDLFGRKTVVVMREAELVSA